MLAMAGTPRSAAWINGTYPLRSVALLIREMRQIFAAIGKDRIFGFAKCGMFAHPVLRPFLKWFCRIVFELAGDGITFRLGWSGMQSFSFL